MSTQTAVPAKKRADLSLFDPIRDFRTEMERLWNLPWLSRSSDQTPAKWSPTTDVYEQNGGLVVKADLPGMKKSDVQVSIEGDYLVLRGERKQESEVEENDYYRSERFFGSFFRSIPLPDGVESSEIKAKFEDGVLEVDVPLPEPSKSESKSIEIS